MGWNRFEHQIHQFLERHSLEGRHLLLAVSGGEDSMSLLVALLRLKEAHRLKLSVGHVHHGKHGELQNFRDEAAGFVDSFCRSHNLPFFLLGPSPEILKSEKQMRDFRLGQLADLRNKESADWLLTAHHSQDELETQLINLIRGTEGQGLVSLSSFDTVRRICRPLLGISKTEVSEYLRSQNQKFMQDPSNQDPQFLRNWIRHEWLKSLEDYRPGATESLSRSLRLISESWMSHNAEDEMRLSITESGFSRQDYLSWLPQQKTRAIATLLKCKGYRQFSAGQLKEIQKELDKEERVHSFKLGSMHWLVNAQQISVEIR